jgi:hypothetical protein
MPTDAEQRAYSRGYQRGYKTGSKREWPEHQPPAPPDPVAARLVAALSALRDEADAICATLDEGDDFVVRLGPLVDDANAALAEVTAWLRDTTPEAPE